MLFVLIEVEAASTYQTLMQRFSQNGKNWIILVIDVMI